MDIFSKVYDKVGNPTVAFGLRRFLEYGPPGNPLFFSSDGVTDTIGQCIRLKDSVATGSYEVSPAVSASFDGATYGKLVDRETGADTSITLVGDFEIRGGFLLLTTSENLGFFGDASTINGLRWRSIGVFNLQITGTSSNFPSGFIPTVGQPYSYALSRSGSDVTLKVYDSANAEVYNQTLIAFSSSDIPINVLGIWNSGLTYPFNGNLWDLHITDSTGVKFSNFLAQDNEVMLSEVGPDVKFVGYTGSPVEESVLYGHEWSNYSEDVLGDEIWVNPAPQIVDDNNYSTYDVETGIGRIVSDGTSVKLQIESALVVGQEYYLDVEYISGTGNLKLSSSVPNIVISEDTESIFTASQAYLNIDRSGACDVYFRASVRRYYTGRIPADPSNPSLDVFGNALTHAGTPQRNFKVYGYTGNWDGVAYGTLDTPLEFAENEGFSIEIPVCALPLGDVGFLSDGGANQNYIRYNGSAFVIKIGGAYSFYDALPDPDGADATLTLTRHPDSSQVTLVYKGSSVTQILSNGPCTFDRISGWSTGNFLTIPMHYIKVYDSADTLIHNWIVESSPASNQDVIYDIVDGNHATLQGATLPFFTAEKEGSKLVGGGYSEDVTDGVDLFVPDIIPSNWIDNEDGTYSSDGSQSGTSILVAQSVLEVGQYYTARLVMTEYQAGYAIVSSGNISTTVSSNGEFDICINEQLEFGAANINVTASVGFIGTVKVTWEKVLTGLIPADPSNPSQDVFGNLLTSPAGSIKDAPILLEMLPNKGGWEADQLAATPQFTNADGSFNKVAPADITAGNNPIYYGEDYKGGSIVGYSTVQDAETDTKIKKVMKI